MISILYYDKKSMCGKFRHVDSYLTKQTLQTKDDGTLYVLEHFNGVVRSNENEIYIDFDNDEDATIFKLTVGL